MTLQVEQRHLKEAFNFLCQRRFDINREDWNSYWDALGISLSDLKIAKSELSQRRASLTQDCDNLELLENIFCCDPFDIEIASRLGDLWNQRSASPHDPRLEYHQWAFNIHNVNINALNNAEPPIQPTANRQGFGIVNILQQFCKLKNLIQWNSIQIVLDRIKVCIQWNSIQIVLDRIKVWREISLLDVLNIFIDLYNRTPQQKRQEIKNFFQAGRTKCILAIMAVITILLLLSIKLPINFNPPKYYFEAKAIEQKGSNALDQFQSQEIEALETAIEAGFRLTELDAKIQVRSHFRKLLSLPTSPILALQTIYNEIHEKNRLINTEIKKIRSLNFHHDKNLIAIGGDNGKLLLLDVSMKTFQKDPLVIEIGQGAISSLSFNSSGNEIASGGISSDEGNKGFVSIVNTSTSTKKILGGCSTSNVSSLQFSSDDRYLVSGGDGGNICLWDLGKNIEEPIYKNDKKVKRDEHRRTYAIAYNKDTKSFAIAIGDNRIDFLYLDPENEDPKKRVIYDSWNHKQGTILDICFSPNGRRMAIADNKGKINVYQSPSLGKQPNKPLYPPLDAFKGHKDLDNNPFLSITFKSEDILFAVVENQNLFKVLEFPISQGSIKDISLNGYTLDKSNKENELGKSGEDKKKNEENKIESAYLNIDDKKLLSISASENDYVRLWDVSGKPKNQTFILSTQQGSVKELSLRSLDSSNGFSSTFLSTLGMNGTVKQWDKEKRSLSQAGLARQKDIKSMVFTPAGDMLVTAHEGGVIKFWNLEGEPIEGLETSTEKQKYLTHISFSSSKSKTHKTILAVADKDGLITFWDWKNNELSRTSKIPTNQGSLTQMSLSPDGNYVVVTGKGFTKIWKPNNTSPIPLGQGINIIGFSPDGKIAIAGRDGTIDFRDEAGKYIGKHDTKQSNIAGISFSQPMNYLATVGSDGSSNVNVIKVWNWQKREPIAEFKSKLTEITSFNFSPDGKYVVVGGDEGKVEVWEVLGLEELLDKGCDWLKDYHAQSKSKATQICLQITSRNDLPQVKSTSN